MAFCPEHDTLKWDQTPEFTPYARRRASPPLSYAESPPALYTGWPLDTGSKKYNSKNSISSRRLVLIRSDVWPQLATFISERMTKINKEINCCTSLHVTLFETDTVWLLGVRKWWPLNWRRNPGGGYSHTLPIRVCAAQRGRDFEAPDLERGIKIVDHGFIFCLKLLLIMKKHLFDV